MLVPVETRDDDGLCESCGSFTDPRVIPSLPLVHASSTTPWFNQNADYDWADACPTYSNAKEVVFTYTPTVTVSATVSLNG